MHLGILFHFDPSVKLINSEIWFLNDLVRQLRPTSVTFIKCFGAIERLLERGNFSFSYTVTQHCLHECDVMVAWNSTNMSNFFGGVVSVNFVKFYDAVSRHTALGKPVLFRSGDSENEIYDYREMVLARAESPNFVRTNETAINLLRSLPEIDYSRFYLLANGERDRFDWVTDTYTVRTRSKLTPVTCAQALYLGDDLFFQVNEHKHRFKEQTSRYGRIPNDHLFWIGFAGGRNSRRLRAFKDLFPAAGVPFTLQTNESLDLPGITCVNQTLPGDTQAYFEHLAGYLGYVFVGKGNPTCAYVNKTVYDCYVSEIPVLVYQKTDASRMIYDSVPDCYFSTPEELADLYRRLLDLTYRTDLVQQQALELRYRLARGKEIGDRELEDFRARYHSDVAPKGTRTDRLPILEF